MSPDKTVKWRTDDIYEGEVRVLAKQETQTNKVLTREVFARWSLEEDHKNGCFDEPLVSKRSGCVRKPRHITRRAHRPDVETLWDNPEHREVYLEEADEYLKLPMNEWPVDITERMAREGYHPL